MCLDASFTNSGLVDAGKVLGVSDCSAMLDGRGGGGRRGGGRGGCWSAIGMREGTDAKHRGDFAGGRVEGVNTEAEVASVRGGASASCRGNEGADRGSTCSAKRFFPMGTLSSCTLATLLRGQAMEEALTTVNLVYWTGG